MGACLFGNEIFNKSVQSSLDGLGHLNDGLRRAAIQVFIEKIFLKKLVSGITVLS